MTLRPSAARERDVAIVGAGVKTPAGYTVEELWVNLCEGVTTARRFEDERFPAGVAVLASRADGFDAARYLTATQARRLDRAGQLAVAAAQDALDQFGRCGDAGQGDAAQRPQPERCAVAVGTGFGSAITWEREHEHLLTGGLRSLYPLTVPMLMPSGTAAALSLRFGFTGPARTICAACASGAVAIGEAMELLRRGAADLVLAGGVDAMVTYGVVAAFLKLDVMSRRVDAPEQACRPFDAERDGFVLGEGAGFVVLQRAEDARAQRREILGILAGHAESSDAHHLVAPDPAGRSAHRCMAQALADAGLSSQDVAHVNAHATGTVTGDLAEAQALRRLFDEWPARSARSAPSVPVTAVKGTTGHLVGGSGAVEAIVTALSVARELVPPVAGLRKVDDGIDLDVVQDLPRSVPAGPALTTSFGFGGANAALVLTPP